MKVELYHTTTELKQLFRKEKNPRLANRIRAVYLALMDKSSPEIAHSLGYSRRTIQNWIYAYNKKGLKGLQDDSGRGQRCKLNTTNYNGFVKKSKKAHGLKMAYVSFMQRTLSKS